jgi:propionyl-CoA carboxylase alpha chain
VQTGSEVSPYYDSMVAKVIAWAETRTAAATLLADSLERARLHGVATNRDLLVRVLRSEQFLAGDTTTDFVQRVPGLTEPRTTAQAHLRHAAVAAVARHHLLVGERVVHASIPAGWRNNRGALEQLELKGEGDPIVVGYDLGGREAVVEVDGHPAGIEVHRVTGDGPDLVVDATVDGVRRRYRVLVGDGELLVDSDLGASAFAVVDPLPTPDSSGPEGGLAAPMPGLVVRVLAAVGDAVEAGQPLLVLEAMKMEHTITSPETGTVAALHVVEGSQVERGAVLAAVDPA